MGAGVRAPAMLLRGGGLIAAGHSTAWLHPSQERTTSEQRVFTFGQPSQRRRGAPVRNQAGRINRYHSILRRIGDATKQRLPRVQVFVGCGNCNERVLNFRQHNIHPSVYSFPVMKAGSRPIAGFGEYNNLHRIP